MEAEPNRRSPYRIIRRTVLACCAIGLSACASTHTSAPSTATSTVKSRPANGPILLTLADSGHKVSLIQGDDLKVELPNQKGSPERWTLLTSGPGVTETSGGVYGQAVSSPPSQMFDFTWKRTTPFGLVMILETPKKKILEPQEFAVTLVPKGYAIK